MWAETGPTVNTSGSGLRAGDNLAELEPERTVDVSGDRALQLSFRLPHPGISYLAIGPWSRGCRLNTRAIT